MQSSSSGSSPQAPWDTSATPGAQTPAHAPALSGASRQETIPADTTMSGPPPGRYLKPSARRTKIQTGFPQPELLDLPWSTFLADWPEDVLVAYPRGISRHVVRFAQVGGRVLAAKETTARNAAREYDLLRRLRHLGTPCVVPVAVVTERHSRDGQELPAVLLTEHLNFSLPYRVLFSEHPDADIADKLVDALALLLVQLHLAGFYWGDVSLSNTLFLRDAGRFAAYLVDAETGELHPQLTKGQRSYDLELARTNVAGELLDLLAGFDDDSHDGPPLDPSMTTGEKAHYEPAAATTALPQIVSSQPIPVDPFVTSERIVETYQKLWAELTGAERFPHEQRWRVAERIQRLNDLGFDVEEASLDTDDDGYVHLVPRVVEPGHHARHLQNITGMSARENQARRILTDITQFGRGLYPGLPEDLTGALWMQEVYAKIMSAVPADLRTKREPAEIVHEVLEHRWFLSERLRQDVPTSQAVEDYVESQLRSRPDEQMML